MSVPSRPRDQVLRLFVAVDLPDNVREALRGLQEQLRGCDLSGLRWVRPEGVHITLKFLGETPAERVSAISEALAAATRGRRWFQLALGKLGTFGGRRGPRVLWVDITGDDERLRELQEAVERTLVEIGFPPEERAFSPHLTLARVRQPPRPGIGERVSRALGSAEPPSCEFPVREVVLMRSTLQPGGAVYEHLAAFPLA